MLGDLLTRVLVMFLGYAYPAFECFKTLEKNKVEIGELRFWCQYWIIVANLTVFERFGDIFISWLPMYGEIKLALFVYLWYPKTKGTGYVYETLLQPYISQHETDIDRKLQELRARVWDLAIFYWQNCTKMGQATFFQLLQYLATQSSKFSTTSTNGEHNHQKSPQPSGTSNSEATKSQVVQTEVNDPKEDVQTDVVSESKDKLQQTRQRLRSSKVQHS